MHAIVGTNAPLGALLTRAVTCSWRHDIDLHHFFAAQQFLVVELKFLIGSTTIQARRILLSASP